MQARCLHLSNIEFEDRASNYFSTVFKHLEVLWLDSCKFTELDERSIVLELPKLKAISIAKMEASMIAPIFDEEHKLYSR